MSAAIFMSCCVMPPPVISTSVLSSSHDDREKKKQCFPRSSNKIGVQSNNATLEVRVGQVKKKPLKNSNFSDIVDFQRFHRLDSILASLEPRFAPLECSASVSEYIRWKRVIIESLLLLNSCLDRRRDVSMSPPTTQPRRISSHSLPRD